MLREMSESSLSAPLSDRCHRHSSRARMPPRVSFKHQLPSPGPTARGGPVKVLDDVFTASKTFAKKTSENAVQKISGT